MTEPAPAPEEKRRFDLFRHYLIAIIGAGVIVYSLIPPIKTAYLTIGGSLLGLDPVIKAAAK